MWSNSTILKTLRFRITWPCSQVLNQMCKRPLEIAIDKRPLQITAWLSSRVLSMTKSCQLLNFHSVWRAKFDETVCSRSQQKKSKAFGRALKVGTRQVNWIVTSTSTTTYATNCCLPSPLTTSGPQSTHSGPSCPCLSSTNLSEVQISTSCCKPSLTRYLLSRPWIRLLQSCLWHLYWVSQCSERASRTTLGTSQMSAPTKRVSRSSSEAKSRLANPRRSRSVICY